MKPNKKGENGFWSGLLFIILGGFVILLGAQGHCPAGDVSCPSTTLLQDISFLVGVLLVLYGLLGYLENDENMLSVIITRREFFVG